MWHALITGLGMWQWSPIAAPLAQVLAGIYAKGQAKDESGF